MFPEKFCSIQQKPTQRADDGGSSSFLFPNHHRNDSDRFLFIYKSKQSSEISSFQLLIGTNLGKINKPPEQRLTQLHVWVMILD